MVYRKTIATEERKGARRKLFLDAATRLFGKHGYHATTIPMIVAVADSSTGSFYMYFRNKEDVFNAALEELGQTITQLMKEVKKNQPDALTGIAQGIEAVFLFLAQNPEQARILIVESSGLSPRLEKTRRNILLEHEEQVKQEFEAEPDLFAVQNPVIAARCMVGGAFEALYNWLDEDPKSRMPAVEVAQAVAQFNTQAVKR
jgi:TetR/AcrR family transcriptional regulator, fatty acid metabolism regulator protein